MKEQIEKLEKEEELLMERVSKIRNAINAFQQVCTHTYENGESAMKHNGRDSHKSYYKCNICNYER